MSIRGLRAEDAERVADLMEVTNRTAAEDEHRPYEAPNEQRRQRLVRSLRRFAGTDAGGCFVDERDGCLTGIAVAIRRGAFWGLSLLFVHPRAQSSGAGRELVARALESAAGATTAMIVSSPDPRAIRRYASAGFELHPGVQVRGAPDLAACPDRLDVRGGGAADLDIVDQVDVPLRGASRRSDVAFVLGLGAALLVADSGSGWVLHQHGNPLMLGASDEDTAARLLWAALAAAPHGEDVAAYCWTSAQRWAIAVALQAKLSISPAGPLFVRGPDAPPGPWLPSGIYF